MISRAKAHQLRVLIEKASASLDDTDALEAVELFPVWMADTDYAVGARCRGGGELFKCQQAHHSQADWRPSVTPALWQKVEKPGQGDTPDNPIPWAWGLEIYAGKYYAQSDVLYRGIRDSGIGILPTCPPWWGTMWRSFEKTRGPDLRPSFRRKTNDERAAPAVDLPGLHGPGCPDAGADDRRT